jgi:hypothetical protein
VFSLLKSRGGGAGGGRLKFALLTGGNPMGPIQLLPSTHITATGNMTGQVEIPYPPNALAYVMKMSARAGGLTDTCDVYVQGLLFGSDWVDLARFTQITGTGAIITAVQKCTLTLTQAAFALPSVGLSNAETRNLVAPSYRVRWVVTAAPGFSVDLEVWGCPM